MISGRFRVFFCAIFGVFDMLFGCKNTKRKRLNQIFCDFGDDELCKKGGLPQCLLGKIYFHDRFWTNNLTRQSVRYYKSKCGLQKTYFLPFISVFTLINSELKNFSSGKVTPKFLIINDLMCHLSLVTFAFTLILMCYIRLLCRKFGGFPCIFPQGLDKKSLKIHHKKMTNDTKSHSENDFFRFLKSWLSRC